MVKTTKLPDNKDIYFIFDESILDNKIGIIACTIFENKDVFGEVQSLLDDIKHRPAFGTLKNAYPHYCEDNYTQIQFLLDQLRYLNYKSYIVFKSYECIADTKYLQEDLLGEFVKPLYEKYLVKYGKNTNFHFFFENLSSKYKSDKELFFNCLQKSSIPLNHVNIEILVKGDRNGICFLPDYICGGFKSFLSLQKGIKDTFGDLVFKSIIDGNGIGLIKYVGLGGEISRYHTSNHADRVKFINDFRGFYKIDK